MVSLRHSQIIINIYIDTINERVRLIQLRRTITNGYIAVYRYSVSCMQNGYTAMHMDIAKNHATHLEFYLQQAARSHGKWVCPSMHKKAYTLCLRPL